ncbi:MAG: hypothetical protein RL318_1122 [Fibrobacterota bacterium]|jgi:hypothetical protein
MRSIGILFLGAFASLASAYPGFSVGDTLLLSQGYGNFIGMSGGQKLVRETIDSIQVKGDTTTIHTSTSSSTTSGFFENPMDGMGLSMLSYGGKHQLVLLHGLPSNVSTGASALRSADWILSDRSTLLFYPSLQPMAPQAPMPILDSSLLPKSATSYLVRLTDTSGIQWTSTNAAPGTFKGILARFKGAADLQGTLIEDTSAYRMQVCTDTAAWSANPALGPLRLRSFRTSSTAIPLNTKPMTLGGGCYSSSITDYRPMTIPQGIHVRRAKVQGPASTFRSVSGRRLGSPAKAHSGVSISVDDKGMPAKSIRLGPLDQ